MTRFIHFGCWNRDGCINKDSVVNNNTPVTKVMTTLKKYISETKPEFITIAGDNYYPKVDTTSGAKIKKIIKQDLISGFECLPKDNKIYLLLGNHDLETNIDVYNKISKNDSILNNPVIDEERKCYILKQQQQYVKDNNNITMDNYKSKDMALHHIIEQNGNKTLVIMIDTNMYDDNAFNKFVTCYEYLTGNKNNYETNPPSFGYQNVMCQNQNSRIIKLIDEKYDENVKNIVFVGHHPIVSFINKKIKSDAEEPYIFSHMERYVNMVNCIFSHIKEKNKGIPKYYNLCADVHLYQHGKLTFEHGELYQYICGTGGTKLDEHVDISKITDEMKNKYNIAYDIRDSQKIHGFLDVDMLETGDLNFKFIKDDGEKYIKMDGGNRKKTKKSRKTKSKKSKKSKNQKKSKKQTKSKYKNN
jgi:hypothetical protein